VEVSRRGETEVCMEILYNPEDRLDMSEYGIAIPISFNNARKTIDEIMDAACVSGSPEEMRPVLLPWYHNRLDAPPAREELAAIHDPGYVDRLLGSESALEREIIRTFELEDENGEYNRYDPDLAQRPLGDLFATVLQRGGGVISAARLAMEKGEAWYFGGGFHHAHYDYGSGFCFYSDTLVARQRLAAGGTPPRTLIIDIDAHKGDGTADLVRRLRSSGDRGVAALSIHMARGWPLDERRKVPGYPDDPAWIPSDVDIPVESGQEELYNSKLAAGLRELIDFADELFEGRPAELAFIVAGADPFEEDMLPSTRPLQLTRTQMLERNTLVRNFLRGRNIPAAWVQAGNYGDHSWKTYTDFLVPLVTGGEGL
jgi:acetoin utilization deacetylase AcuC-like enzyme